MRSLKMVLVLLVVFGAAVAAAGCDNCKDGGCSPTAVSNTFTATFKMIAIAEAKATCSDGTIATARAYAEVTGKGQGATQEEAEQAAMRDAKKKKEEKEKDPVFVAAAYAEVRCAQGTPTPIPPTPIPPTPPATCPTAGEISPTYRKFAYPASWDEFNVTMRSDCSWTARSNDSWIVITSGHSGTGNGQVRYNVLENTGTSTRTGTITAAGRTYTVEQEGRSATPTPTPVNCVVGDWVWGGWYPISATRERRDATRPILVDASNGGQGCPSLNQSEERPIAVAPCTFVVAPNTQSFVYQGGNGSITVTPSRSGCPWTAVSNNTPWLVVTGGASGSESGTPTIRVEANTGAARTGTLTVAGETVTIHQAAAPVGTTCSYTVPDQLTFPSTSTGNGSFTVSASHSSCRYEVKADPDAWFVEIKSGATGAGTSSTVVYTVANHTGTGERKGNLTFTALDAPGSPTSKIKVTQAGR